MLLRNSDISEVSLYSKLDNDNDNDNDKTCRMHCRKGQPDVKQ